LIYWRFASSNLKFQNLFVLSASYVFYGWWDWKFLSLILLSTLVDYCVGLKISSTEKSTTRKFYLIISLLTNLGLLGFFKYFNFFLDNLSEVYSFFGISLQLNSLNIILPVGISFYTFQTLSYTIDIYRNKILPEKDFIAFAAFVSFFPQLVAGPIERASNLLPQFTRNRKFDYSKAVDGLRQILWGLVKKVVIADNCARIANIAFDSTGDFSGSTLFVGVVFFAFQIYGDFSGYSDIAIGTARLFGFDLKQNFAFPYFSRDIAEFWRRWHISLSTWFRDYLYIPLGGSRGSLYTKIRNTMIIFLVSGFWHGPNWTFIIWGALNAIYFLPLLIFNRNRQNIEIVAINSHLPTLKDSINILATFSITCLAWIFFRAENLDHAFNYISRIFDKSLFTIPKFPGAKLEPFFLFLLLTFIIFEWFGRRGKYALEKLALTWNRPFRWALYYLLIVTIFWYSNNEQEFIYFQF